LLFVEPSELLDNTLMKEWHDGQPAPEYERAGLREEHEDLEQYLVASDL
jgi:hypothetical protein